MRVGENLWKSNSGGGGFKIEWYYVVSAAESKNIRFDWIGFNWGVEWYCDGTKIHFCGFIDWMEENRIKFNWF